MAVNLVGAAHATAVAYVPHAGAAPNIAFYYQGDLPVNALQAFDIVVVDPDRATLPDAELAPHTSWYARLDLRGKKSAAADAVAQFIGSRVQPLWDQGYRGFLLDDGASVDVATSSSDTMIAAVIEAIRTHYPQAGLMLRNHLDIARARAAGLTALVIDSLYQKPAGFGGLMGQVAESTRLEILNEIKLLQAEHGLQVVAMDYCPATDKTCRRELAQRLLKNGVQPFVTAPGVGLVGIGAIEVMPRTILMVQSMGALESVGQSVGVMALAMPLNYLGYDIRYVDLNSQNLPANITSDRYAGIVVVMNQSASWAGIWRQWLLARIREGMRVAVVGHFGFAIDGPTATALSLQGVPGVVPRGSTPRIVHQASLMGFEALPTPDARGAVGIKVQDESQALLRVAFGSYTYDAAAFTPWGGYVLEPYGVVSKDSIDEYNLAFQPLDFFKKTLRLPQMPVPDVTSENGRRLMFTQVDGDGFASQAEFTGAATVYSGQVLYDQILTKYPIPMTISVIEGEVAASGAYPSLSTALEPIARKIFQLPNVEIGSHTYSHPFFFWQIDNTTGKRVQPFYQTPEAAADPFSLNIPGYEFDLNREISGSIDYINQRLAPPDKKVVAMLWSGDAEPPGIVLRTAADAGVLSINGGNTVITRSKNSWTNIAAYGVAKGEDPKEYQVYAATMNENVYTNYWLGPFYGFNRVLETFAMTNEPIRFKAVDIYYHFYSATKKASLAALQEVFSSVMKQAIFPIYTTEYIRRVHQWRRVAVAREGDHWLVRSGADLRQLRWPGQGVPDLSSASGVAGYLQGPGGLYIHMGGDQARFAMTSGATKGVPYISEASGFIRNFQRQGRELQFDLGGYYQPFVQFSGMSGCKPSVAGGARQSRRSADTWRLDLSGHPAQPVAYHTIRVHCE